jgi:hypothetical protein
MASHHDIIVRWLDTLEGKRDGRGNRMRNIRGSNVYAEGSVLYSYGSHFHLAEYYPSDRRRHRALFLLNADRVSNTTTRHQSDTRGAVYGRAPSMSADVILLPFSALDAAGIIHETIRPLEVREDAWLTVDERPVPCDITDVSAAEVSTVQRYRYGRTPAESGNVDVQVYTWRAEGYTFSRDQYPDAALSRYVTVSAPNGAPRQVDESYGNGFERLIRTVHRMGDSVFTAETAETVRRRRPVTVLDVVRAGVATAQNQTDARRPRRSDEFSRGPESLLRDPLALLDTTAPIVETDRVRRRRRYVSSFDTNEPAPLYFLATLPASSRARTVDDAILDLAPAAVHAAVLRGVDVVRQGDIFAIATNLLDADMAGFERARLTLWTRDNVKRRPHEPGYVAPFSAADRRELKRRAVRMWRARWRRLELERTARGIPPNPRGIRARFADLRAKRDRDIASIRNRGRRAVLRGDIRGVASARQSLGFALERGKDSNGFRSPAHARDATLRTAGREPCARALSLWRDCLTAAAESMRPNLRRQNRERAAVRTRALLSVHGTAHSATEVARGPGGAVYMRGTLRQVPSLDADRGNERDHRPVRLGDGATWYLAVRNTVPRARGGA